MAEFISAVTTDAGIILSTDLLAGERLEFTKLVAGAGVYGADDLVRSKLQKQNKLRDQKQEFGISRVEKVTDSCVVLETLISNSELTEGYRMTEVGIYARKKGEEGDGILYSLAVATEPDYLPHFNGVAPVEIVEEYYITVSDASTVSIHIRPGSVLLIEDFLKFKQEIQEKLKEIPLLWQRIDELQEEIDQLKPTEVIHAGGRIFAGNSNTALGNMETVFLVSDESGENAGGLFYIGADQNEVPDSGVMFIISDYVGDNYGGEVYAGNSNTVMPNETVLLVTN